MTNSIYASSALIGTQWEKNVVISIDQFGLISSIQKEVVRAPEGCYRCHGPIIPGISNTHSHAFQRLFAGMTEHKAFNKSQANKHGIKGNNFWSWREHMYRFAHRLTPAHQHIIAEYLYIQMLKSGYTSVGEFHYLHNQPNGKHYDNRGETSHAIINAAQSSGINITHLPVYYARSGFSAVNVLPEQQPFFNSVDDYLNLVEDLASYYEKSNFRKTSTIAIGIAFHSLRAVNEQDMKTILKQSPLTHSPVHIHIAEQKAEVEACEKAYNRAPVTWLLDQFDVNQRWSLIHGTHANEQEITRVAASGATIGLCPTTEANLGDGIFPLMSYIKANGAWSIGSDSQVTIDPFEEMKILEYVHRLQLQRRAIFANDHYSSATTLLTQALLGGSQSLGNNAGKIEVGKKADLLVLDNDHALLYEKEDSHLLDTLVFVGGCSLIRDVMVGGQWVIKNRVHQNEAVAEQRYKRCLKQILTS